jgi:hypothetical protein
VKTDDDYRSNACTQLVESDVLDRIRERTAQAELARIATAAKAAKGGSVAKGVSVADRGLATGSPRDRLFSALRQLRHQPR